MMEPHHFKSHEVPESDMNDTERRLRLICTLVHLALDRVIKMFVYGSMVGQLVQLQAGNLTSFLIARILSTLQFREKLTPSDNYLLLLGEPKRR